MFALLLLLFSTVFALDCPVGYIPYIDGISCISSEFSFGTRDEAFRRCTADGAYLMDIANAFDSSYAVQNLPSGGSVWIGLTCTMMRSPYTCQWDTGRNVTVGSYINFDKKEPKADEDGTCVRLDGSTQKWASMPCLSYPQHYKCKYTPGIQIKDCGSNSDAFWYRGKCYFISKAANQYFDHKHTNATQNCPQCSRPALIIDSGVDLFLVEIGTNATGTRDIYVLSVTVHNTQTPDNEKAIWYDGTVSDFSLYTGCFTNTFTNPCTFLRMRNTLACLANEWYVQSCSNGNGTFCSYDAGSVCT